MYLVCPGVPIKNPKTPGTIPDRNIKCMISKWWKTQVPFWGNLFIIYSVRTGCVKPRVERLRLRKRVRNVCIHARRYHLCYTLNTQRRITDTETVIIPWLQNVDGPNTTSTWDASYHTFFLLFYLFIIYCAGNHSNFKAYKGDAITRKSGKRGKNRYGM